MESEGAGATLSQALSGSIPDPAESKLHYR
jgi:hypothetical protein